MWSLESTPQNVEVADTTLIGKCVLSTFLYHDNPFPKPLTQTENPAW